MKLHHASGILPFLLFPRSCFLSRDFSRGVSFYLLLQISHQCTMWVCQLGEGKVHFYFFFLCLFFEKGLQLLFWVFHILVDLFIGNSLLFLFRWRAKRTNGMKNKKYTIYPGRYFILRHKSDIVWNFFCAAFGQHFNVWAYSRWQDCLWLSLNLESCTIAVWCWPLIWSCDCFFFFMTLNIIKTI